MADEQKEEETKTEEKAPEAPKAEEPKVEEKKEEKKEEKSAPNGKFKDIIKEIENLKVADLAELVKELEDRFGVSAAMTAAPIASAAGAGAGTETEEKSSFTVVLTDSGAQKIAVIKAVREIRPDLGLKEAKDLVDAPPKELLKDAKKEPAEEAKKKIEAAGGKVELK
ncbi:50S ribosomal protein L7/L12 [Candidatus Berkelbacteria bacterium]|nr:50S ribosomal protein L7/L12 [Candidatus Berkelbacteria bacterium]